MDRGAATILGRHVGGIDGGMAAADDDGAIGFRRELYYAVEDQNPDRHRLAVYIARGNAPTVDTKVPILILQHPPEQAALLGTATLFSATLANTTLTVARSCR